MAKKFVIFTGAVGVAAVVAGAFAARHRRGATTTANQSRPVRGAADSARRFATEWKTDDTLASEFASVVDGETAAAH